MIDAFFAFTALITIWCALLVVGGAGHWIWTRWRKR